MTIPRDRIVLSSPKVQFAGWEWYSGINRDRLILNVLAVEEPEPTTTLAVDRTHVELAAQLFSAARQQLAVLDELMELRKKRPDLGPFFREDRPEPFFVKNLENVQGDERDRIILSVAYGLVVRGSPAPAQWRDRRSPRGIFLSCADGRGDRRSGVSAGSGDPRRTGRRPIGTA